MNETRSNDTPVTSALPVLDRLDATHEQMRYWLGELQSLVNHMEDRGWDTWARLIIWLVIGLMIYFFYGRRHSRVQMVNAAKAVNKYL